MYLILTPAHTRYFNTEDEVNGQMMALYARDLSSLWEMTKKLKEPVIYKLDSLKEVKDIQVDLHEIHEEQT